MGSKLAASCVGLVKIYWASSGEVHALKGVDALFPAGTVTAIVGPSGSGKSSLLRILAGLDRATAGIVTVGGQDLQGLSQRRLRLVRRRLVGYVFQRPADNLLPYLTAAEHIAHIARVRRVGDVDPVALLERVGLAERRNHRPDQLSGGEQQRLGVAQAISGGPALIVADEPTAELDSASGSGVLEVLHELAAGGLAVALATHERQAVEAADQVLHLRHGALQSERRDAGTLSVIDAAGRILLPPEALRLFAERRAVLHIDTDQVRIAPPTAGEG